MLGKHDHRTAKELFTSIYKAVTERCRKIISDKPCFALLTDGSQARKTGDDKEMVLIQTEHKGRYKSVVKGSSYKNQIS